MLLRNFGVPRDPLRFLAPDGVTGARLSGAHDDPQAQVEVADGQVEVRVALGEYVLEWTRA